GHISDRVAVMYLGRIVETGKTEDVFARPRHPYTQALLAELPRITPKRRQYVPIQGELPSPLAPPAGCHFHPRCPRAIARCQIEAPQLRRLGPELWASCHLAA